MDILALVSATDFSSAVTFNVTCKIHDYVCGYCNIFLISNKCSFLYFYFTSLVNAFMTLRFIIIEQPCLIGSSVLWWIWTKLGICMYFSSPGKSTSVVSYLKTNPDAKMKLGKQAGSIGSSMLWQIWTKLGTNIFHPSGKNTGVVS